MWHVQTSEEVVLFSLSCEFTKFYCRAKKLFVLKHRASTEPGGGSGAEGECAKWIR